MRCWIGLGSNMGDREAYLEQAIYLLNMSSSIRVIQRSSIYETDPYGPVKQTPFLNMVLEAETELSPLELLDLTQSIEKELNRKREIHWGPRTIDLDILLYADKIIKMDTLIVPHPEMAKRLFVLVPLWELEKNLVIPGINKSIQELYNLFTEQKGVRLWKQSNGVGGFGLFENSKD